MEKRLLSVIVPIYNVEVYLSECIDTILNQTYENIEIILVDDGSRDSSGAICDRYKKLDKRVKVIHKQNEGPIAARLTGVNNASGEYVTFVDSDDWIHKDMYEELMKLQKQTNAEVVMSGIYRYISEDNILEHNTGLQEGFYNREQIRENIWPVMLWGEKCNSCEVDPSLCTKIFKKELICKQLKKVAKLDIYYADDTITLYPLLLETSSLYISHQSYYFHRQRGNEEVAGYIKDTKFFDKTYRVYKYLQKVFSEYQLESLFERQLDYFFMNSMQLRKQCYSNVIEQRQDIFPFFEINKGERIILYGAGVTGRKYIEQNGIHNFCNIVMWVDKGYQRLQNEGLNVVSPLCIENVGYDKVLVAIHSQWLAEEIMNELVQQGVPKEKIVWAGASVLKFEK